MFTGFVIVLAIILAMAVIALALRNDTLKTTLSETEGHLANEKRNLALVVVQRDVFKDEVSNLTRELDTAKSKISELEDTAKRQSDVITASTDLLDGILKIQGEYSEEPLTPAPGSPIFGVSGDGTFTEITSEVVSYAPYEEDKVTKPAPKKRPKPKQKNKQKTQPKAKPKAKPKTKSKAKR